MDVGSTPQTDLSQSWRIRILEELRSRLPETSSIDFKNYHAAIETTSWIRKGEARCLLSSNGSTTSLMYEDCVLQLEWVDNTGTFTVLNPDGATTKVDMSKLLTEMKIKFVPVLESI